MQHREIAGTGSALDGAERGHVRGSQIPFYLRQVAPDAGGLDRRRVAWVGHHHGHDERRHAESRASQERKFRHDGVPGWGKRATAPARVRRGGPRIAYFMMIIFFVNRLPSTTNW